MKLEARKSRDIQWLRKAQVVRRANMWGMSVQTYKATRMSIRQKSGWARIRKERDHPDYQLNF